MPQKSNEEWVSAMLWVPTQHSSWIEVVIIDIDQRCKSYFTMIKHFCDDGLGNNVAGLHTVDVRRRICLEFFCSRSKFLQEIIK